MLIYNEHLGFGLGLKAFGLGALRGAQVRLIEELN
jgi:hypothetical protein